MEKGRKKPPQPLPAYLTRGVLMITVLLYRIKYQTQKDYNKFLKSIGLDQLKRNCDRYSNLIVHGYYQHFIRTLAGENEVKVVRVICKSCKKKHALLPTEIALGPQTQRIQTSSEPKNEYLTQESYDSFVENMEFHQLQCSCSVSGNFIKHGYYLRFIKTSDGKIKLKISRVICKS